MYDLVSIGDITVDVFLELNPEVAQSVCYLDRERCVVSFDYASKIPVSKMTRLAGVGNAANNAIGASRLGLKSAIYTVTGSDPDSLESKKILESEDVSSEFLVLEPDKRSNFSCVINYSAERTIFVYHEERVYIFPQLPQVSWVYYTSTGIGNEAINAPLVKYLKANQAKLGFNPGSHHLKGGLDSLKDIFAISEVLFLNREEAHSLVGGDLQDIKGLVKKLKELGPKAVVITDGRQGSYASIDGREVWFAGIPEASPVVERTGCGDAYATGFVAAMFYGKDLPEAMVWGTMNSTSVIQFVGAREGLLTQRGIDEFVGRYGEYVKPRMV